MWGSTSLLTQVTVAPTDTVAGFGTYAVVVSSVAPLGMEIVTGVGLPPGVGVGVGVGVAGEVGLLLPQPDTRIAAVTNAKATDRKRIGTLSPAASRQPEDIYCLRIS